MNSDKDGLILEYKNFVHQVVGSLINSMGLPSSMFEEYASAGYLGLVEAAERFDPTRGASFKTFAFLRIRGAVIDSIRDSSTISGKAYKNARALQACQDLREEEYERRQRGLGGKTSGSGDDDEKLASVLDFLATGTLVFRMSTRELENEPMEESVNLRDPHLNLERREERVLMRKLVDSLPEREKRVIREYYFEGKSFVRIAQENGDMSRSWVSRLHSRALKLLKVRYCETFSA